MDSPKNDAQPMLDRLREKIPAQAFDTWFQDVVVEGLVDGKLTLRAPNKFVGDWIERHFQEPLRHATAETFGAETGVKILSGTLSPAPAPLPPAKTVSLAGSRSGEDCIARAFLSPQYTFENFIVGPSNRLCHAAALAVADKPGQSYNPLFLHGAVGLGKTHLLQAVCHVLLDRDPGVKILYLSCETFVNHFVSAVEKGDLDRFRSKYRYADVLVVDDIHFLANKERTQEEFFHTFNSLYNAQKQIILASDSAPQDIPALEERLTSRFKWGLVAELEPPHHETRMAIVNSKARLRGVAFPDDVTDFIATHVASNVRELEGAITKIIGYSAFMGGELSLKTAKEALKDIVALHKKIVLPADIRAALVKLFGVRPEDLCSKRRSKSVAYPRQIGMYLARKLTSLSLEDIGAQFGGKDHSTVLYAIAKIEKDISASPETKGRVEHLFRVLQ